MVVIGGSAGGLDALSIILELLPEAFNIPVLIVLHRGTDPDNELVPVVQNRTHLHVVEPNDKEEIRPGHIYIAPPDYHILVNSNQTICLNVDERHCYCRPAIDPLFISASDALGASLTGILLSGSNADGAEGVAYIASNQGRVVIQDPRDASFRAMPEAGIDRLSDPLWHGLYKVIPLAGIAKEISKKR